MKRAIVFLASFACSAFSSQAAIDLTPALKEYTSEGIAFKQLVFNDGAGQISYDLPSRWSYRADGDSIKLAPPNGSDADVVILARPLPRAQPFDDNGIAAAREHFVQGVPASVQAMRIVSEQLNTVPFKADNYEITASYEALGKIFTRRALYINLPGTQLIFRLSARNGEFDGLWRTLRRSILSWQSQEPSAAVAEK
jgi:hypothetical protein